MDGKLTEDQITQLAIFAECDFNIALQRLQNCVSTLRDQLPATAETMKTEIRVTNALDALSGGFIVNLNAGTSTDKL